MNQGNQDQYNDIQERCVEQDCRKKYIITAGEQAFYAQKGFQLPRRCPDCRAKRKREKQQGQGY